MSQPKQVPLITVEQYLALERAAENRHEYVDGVIYGMAGESLSHGHITANLLGLLHQQLRGKPCAPFIKDTKVRSGPRSGRSAKGLFSYPDIVVVCGEPEVLDENQDVITNPTAIIEVLSESTSHFDRTVKFERYREWTATLVDYVLVSQDRPCVEHYRKLGDEWGVKWHTGQDGGFEIPSIGCALKLAEIYERVRFLEGDET